MWRDLHHLIILWMMLDLYNRLLLHPHFDLERVKWEEDGADRPNEEVVGIRDGAAAGNRSGAGAMNEVVGGVMIGVAIEIEGAVEEVDIMRGADGYKRERLKLYAHHQVIWNIMSHWKRRRPRGNCCRMVLCVCHERRNLTSSNTRLSKPSWKLGNQRKSRDIRSLFCFSNVCSDYT